MESDFAEDDGDKSPVILNKSRDSEQREIDEFEEEERRLLAEDAKSSPGLMFALPGRWTGGKREVSVERPSIVPLTCEREK